MYPAQRNQAFSQLGLFLEQFTETGSKSDVLSDLNSVFYDNFDTLLSSHIHFNGWFGRSQIESALTALVPLLKPKTLETWLSDYELESETESKTVLVVMPSNLPLVGFQDFAAVLLTGHRFLGRCSDQNKWLLPLISKVLIAIHPDFESYITFSERINTLDYDAVIATGSNNSARYFEYYFSKKPNIIRKNRTSVAVLTGKETTMDLKALAKDIGLYFGRGCRSISKLYLPTSMSIDLIFEALFAEKHIIENNKYANNYDYHRALYLMGQQPFLDNGFMILKEDKGLHSPISVLYYSFYDSIQELENQLNELESELQCTVSNHPNISSKSLGEAQRPTWKDYADNIDTIQFLTQL
ncbi:MAG: acyl-CoA reductase [Flavobacteriales bacterium]